MDKQQSSKVKEGWNGPAQRDVTITPLKPGEDGLHIDMSKKGSYEWWYFDAHFESGHTIVVFFHASNPNPGMAGKSGVEIVLLRPDGRKTRKFIPYPVGDFSASREMPDVKIGKNYMKAAYIEGKLPIYEIHIEEKDLSCHLVYQALVNGWKPGSGYSHFGKMGFFAWVVPFARASVKGMIYDGETAIKVSGVGYHDHNWLNFQFPKIIRYWMWGRICSENHTVSYAYIQCNNKMDNHAVKVLMVAEGEDVILSTGNFDFRMDDFEYNPQAKHRYPEKIAITVPGEFEANLSVSRVLEAEDMLENFNPILRFIVKNIVRIRPGYFRLISDFDLHVAAGKKTRKEKGSTLHEIVMFNPVE